MIAIVDKSDFEPALEDLAIAITSATSSEGLPVRIRIDVDNIKSAILKAVEEKNPELNLTVSAG